MMSTWKKRASKCLTKERLKRRCIDMRRLLRFSALTIMGILFFFLEVGYAQDLINTGTINNTGLFRVKNRATGIDSVNGRFEYFGGDQTLVAKQYNYLVLSGSGTKTTTPGNVTVSSDASIGSNTILKVDSASLMVLKGNLSEQGYLTGSIQKTVDLSGATTSSGFGNIGTTISWLTTPPGVTAVTRASGASSQGKGNQSIKRYYDISPAKNSGLDATLVFGYNPVELNGQNPSKLLLWKSTDGGQNWKVQGGIVDTSARTLTRTGITSFGRWTASDSAHALGPLRNAAANIFAFSAPRETAVVLTKLQSFVIAVTDPEGRPVDGQTVVFAIDSIPNGATGQSLTTASAITDTGGHASTTLTLGTRIGTYIVSASTDTLKPARFFAQAMPGAPAMLAFASGNSQDTVVAATLRNPFVVTVTDSLGNPVKGVPVQFALVDTPNGASGQKLSAQSLLTDSLGHASTLLTLGSKVGAYTVQSTSAGLKNSPVTFTANARSASASMLAMTSGGNQTGVVGATLDHAFVAVVSDSFGNPVRGTSVQFAVTGIPLGATGDSLTVLNGVTDSLGNASAILRLGNKVGMYTVQASANGLKNSPIPFNTNAIHAPAFMIALTSGDRQVGTVASTLVNPFVVAITDTFGNPIKGDTVQFAVSSTPDGARGQHLSGLSVVTDSTGQASSVLTLGNRMGSYTVQASSPGLRNSPVTFTAQATSQHAAVMALTSGDDQRGTVLAFLANPFIVSVTDSFGNPVNGAVVTYAITGKPATAVAETLSVASVATDSLGRASSVLKLGNRIGTYLVQAASAGLANSPITFTAHALSSGAAAVTLAAGDHQTGRVTTTLANPFVVMITDASGNPVQNSFVRFNISAAPTGTVGQTLSDTLATTDSTGRVTTLLKLGTKAGIYTVTARAAELPAVSVMFSANALPSVAATIAMSSGDNQSATVATLLSQPFVVTVTDSFANPVSGRNVNFTITSAPAGAAIESLSVTTAVTDTFGQSSTVLRLGTKVGNYTVQATSSGLFNSPISFTARASAAAAFAMAKVSGDSQSVVIRSVLHDPFIVTITDAYGNAVHGASVTFAITGAPAEAVGETLSVASAVTDSAGTASTILMLGTKIGTYTVTATSGLLSGSPITFSARGFAGQAAAMVLASGDNQSKSILESLDQPFVVTVTDIGGNVVPGVRVDFAVESTPARARGYALSTSGAVSDVNGRSSTVLTVGDRPGLYTVTATSTGLLGSPMSFHATATVLLADANSDGSVNIADLTTMIDAILHNILLTEADSVKADINGDGVIDARDAAITLEGLLHGTWDTSGISSARMASLTQTVQRMMTSHNVKSEVQAGIISSNTQAVFELTPNGLRFNLNNDIPIKGIQIALKLRNPSANLTPDVLFNRAKMMQVPVNDTLGIVHIVVYNNANDPITPDSGSIFRLPLTFSDTSDFDVRYVVVSTNDDRGIQIPVTKVVSSTKYPVTYVLEQNYPNPFNNETKIQFVVPDIPERFASVLVQVYDVAGQRVATVVHGNFEAGRYTFSWNGTNDQGLQVASGVYLLRLWAPEHVLIKKMVLMK